jgi:choline dehydrogenase
MEAAGSRPAEPEYIVVGSGAGGGTLAARLAEAGRKVLLLEAGGDPQRLADARLPDDYRVPAFHPFASENEAMRWDFFVRHYAADARQRRDEKYVEHADGRRVDGVLYPRAGTLGGCTAHNALLLVYPHNADWDYVAGLTGDSSWKAANMRTYFERMEDCRHRPLKLWIKKILGRNPSRHGFGGWLATEWAFPEEALGNRRLRRILERSAIAASRQMGGRLKRLNGFLKTRGDPNDWRSVESNSYGLRFLPLTTRDHIRVGSGDRLREIAAKYPDRLTLELDALVTRVLFDENRRALGVEYLKGERLYRAHANPSRRPGEKRQAFASRETILSGGAFNTPQLLLLSGIGAAEELRAHGIDVVVDLPGVGRNLQDRYEVGVVNRMREDWEAMAGATFDNHDRQYGDWERKKGVYITNGSALSLVQEPAAGEVPDLFFLGLLAKFKGYFPGYSGLVKRHRNYLTWVVLKAHTINTAGTVKLRSPDPRDTPCVNFHYFDEGNDPAEKDLNAVVRGIRLARMMTAAVGDYLEEEELPGSGVQTDDELRQFVKDNAWGHHASCTCPIGPREEGGVVDGKFRVYGTKGLRVVDASVFPKIPGFFIVSAVYMIGEKAADVILADAKPTR